MKRLVAVLLLLGMVAPGCKIPPLATAYRLHGQMTVTQNAADEGLAIVYKAKFQKCESTYNVSTPESKAALIKCLKAVRADLAVWVQKIKPALASARAGLWALLETIWVASDKKLDKTSKAAIAACEWFGALEKTLSTYKDKLGTYGAMLVALAAGGKVLVCR